MDLKLELTFEQRFNIRKHERELSNLSHEEKDRIIIQLMRQLFVKDNLVKDFMRKEIEAETGGLQAWLAEFKETNK